LAIQDISDFTHYPSVVAHS